MFMVPFAAPLPHTRHSRELAKHVEQLVRDYRRDHPELTEAEIHTALMQSLPAGASPEAVRRRIAMGIGLAAAVIGAFVAIASNAGRMPIDLEPWKVVGIVATICVGVVAVLVRARQS
jgi:hypothetical protein